MDDGDEGRVPTFDPAILGYYDEANEQFRLDRHPLEALRTQELLLRFLPPAPARIVDVGGGPGFYAAWLADLGYDIHLVDPVPLHVEQSTALAAGRFTAAVGDARVLAEPDASADAVLLLGPLYHLVDRADRVAALSEAGRVVRPGGVVAAALISRAAALLDGLARDLLLDPGFGEKAHLAFAGGVLESNRASGFTRAYFHQPAEVEPEVVDAGLAFDGVYGIEGLGGWLPDIASRLDDPAVRAMALDVARALEQDPSTLGMSGHLLAVARRPS